MEKSILYLIIYNFLIYSLTNVINQTIHSIPLKKGAKNFCENRNPSTFNNITNEFGFFEQYIDCDYDHAMALNRGEREKDRYSDIKSYNHNIVNITTGSKYINASPINIITKKYFISTQGPKNETIEDFWTMIEEYECNIIIMLCNIVEGGREKCAKYWDEKNKMNNYSIHLNKEETRNKYIIRELKLINKKSGKEKNLIQIHFTGWPDHGIPDTSDDKIFEVFEEMIKLVDQYKGNGPIVVHCSAGVGRTGTFISMYYLDKEIKTQIKEKKEIIRFNIFNLVRKLKEMRICLVQSNSQYNFIYLFVNYLLKRYNN
jgi:protein tyrosine phosphatase